LSLYTNCWFWKRRQYNGFITCWLCKEFIDIIIYQCSYYYLLSKFNSILSSAILIYCYHKCITHLVHIIFIMIYSVIHQACSRPFFPLIIINLSEYWFLEFLNILVKGHFIKQSTTCFILDTYKECPVVIQTSVFQIKATPPPPLYCKILFCG